MLPSIFRQKIDQRANESQDFYRSSSTGVAINALSVISHQLYDNPYYYAINNITLAQAQNTLNDPGDTIKTGIAIVVKQPGASKETQAYINPNATSQYGDETGKTKSLATDDADTAINEAQMIHNGANNPNPIVYDMHRRQINPIHNVSQTPQDSADNSPTGTDASPVKVPGIDPATGKEFTSSESGRSYYGKMIRTGTHVISNQQLGVYKFIAQLYDLIAGIDINTGQPINASKSPEAISLTSVFQKYTNVKLTPPSISVPGIAGGTIKL